MTFLRYLALGIAGIGLSYSIYANQTQNRVLAAQPPIQESNESASSVQNYSDLSCPQLHDIIHDTVTRLISAEYQRMWYGPTLGWVITDAKKRHKYEALEGTLAQLHEESVQRCEPIRPLYNLY